MTLSRLSVCFKDKPETEIRFKPKLSLNGFLFFFLDFSILFREMLFIFTMKMLNKSLVLSIEFGQKLPHHDGLFLVI